MALILQLETATISCSVTLALDGEVIAFKELYEKNIHASHLTLFIQQVIKEAGKVITDIEAVAISMGPGSYTGLRIGVSTAKGLCYALDIPLIAINTLQSMTSGFISSGCHSNKELLYCPMIDARRMEVYTAVYDSHLKEILPVQAKVLEMNSFKELLKINKIIFFGDGAFKCRDILAGQDILIDNDFVNSARHMSVLAHDKFVNREFEDVAYFEPFYLKDFLILKPNKVL